MKILITGGTGFIGSRLASRLAGGGRDVVILSRSRREPSETAPQISYLEGDPTRSGHWQEAVRTCDAAVNLAGTSIFSPWTRSNKRRILESRVAATRNLVEAIGVEGPKPAVLISASAIGYYGFRGDEDVDESGLAGQDFLAGVTAAWEAEAARAEAKLVRVVRCRFGIVLGGRGGALGQMLPLYRLGLGGPLGSGRQWFSWIHVDDLVDALIFALDRPALAGAVNMDAPAPVRNRDLAKALGRALRRPAFLRMPGFALRIALGEFSLALLRGQKVIPAKLLAAGFAFRYPEIGAALADILPRPE
jgi:uncharacterized protein (TIGR01777 family)